VFDQLFAGERVLAFAQPGEMLRADGSGNAVLFG